MNRIPLASAGASVRSLGRRVLQALAREYALQIARAVFLALPPRSPVGPMVGTRAKGKRAKGAGPNRKLFDKHAGLFRASHRVSVETPAFADLAASASYTIPGAMEFAAGTRGFSPGQTIYFTNDAHDAGRSSYASILEGGRRADKNGRMIGSPQAPKGIFKPTVEEDLPGMADEIAAKAVRKVEARFGGAAGVGA